MDKKILVENYIREGESLIRSLDLAQFPVYAALWFFDTGSENWKLLIATPHYDTIGPHDTYEEILHHTQDLNEVTLKDIQVLSPNNQLINLLRSALHTNRDQIAGIRFSGNTINNIYIPDTYIYRLS